MDKAQLGKLTEKMDCWMKDSNMEALMNVASTVTVWDFNTALGDTISEKYESIYVKMVEVSNVMVRKGSKGYFWVCTSPEAMTLFECTLKLRTTESVDYFPMGVTDRQYMGTLDRRWRLYADPMFPQERILIGCGTTCKPENLARISIANFII